MSPSATDTWVTGSPPLSTEVKLIEEFRKRVSPLLNAEEDRSDNFLLRWIRARDGNLDKAEAMLKNSLKWRVENDIKNVLSKPLDPFIVEHYPFHTEAQDIHGRPVREVHVGGWDLRKAMDAGKEKEFQHFINYFFETIMIKIKESGNLNGSDWPHTQFIYICDWEGYSYSQLMHLKSVQALLKFGSQYEAHYPEICQRVYFINCPSIMPLFMALLKPILAPRTYEKIKIYGSNREEWEPALKEIIHPDKLWTRLGGNRIVLAQKEQKKG